MLDEANRPFSTCMRCDCCDGFPCIVHAKSDAEVLGVRPALEHPNVELWTNAEARRLIINDSGTELTGVIVRATAPPKRCAAIWWSCRAGRLRPAAVDVGQRAAPQRARQRLDQVGRNYMFHNSQAVPALSREENPTVFQKTLGLNDFYFSGPDFQFRWATSRWSASRRRRSSAARNRGDEARGELDAARRGPARGRLLAVTEDLPRLENRVTIDRDGTITIAYKNANEEPKRRLFEQLKSMLSHVDDIDDRHLLPHHWYLKNEMPVAGCAHQAGTCRFGIDPSSSVLDPHCKAHELDNLSWSTPASSRASARSTRRSPPWRTRCAW